MTALVMSGAASAAKPKPTPKNAPVVAGSQYLALGDSFAFGYREAGTVPAPNYDDPSSFPGYPGLLGSELHLKVTNAACPGETSASFINPAAQSNGCENSVGEPDVGYRLSYPLHVSYHGSQLAYALSYLKSHKDVRLVSLMIGGNDALICLEHTADGCTSSSELNAVFGTVKHNVGVILHAIRKKAHYNGQLVVVNYPSPVAALNPRVMLLNEAIDHGAKPFGVEIADAFGEFQLADAHSGGNPCTAGLVNQLGTGGCGIHPSYAGYALLAQAVEKVIHL